MHICGRHVHHDVGQCIQRLVYLAVRIVLDGIQWLVFVIVILHVCFIVIEPAIYRVASWRINSSVIEPPEPKEGLPNHKH